MRTSRRSATRRWRRRLVDVPVLLVCVATSARAFEKDVHADITASLSFLTPPALATITSANLGRDDWWKLWRKRDVWHFNDCAFAETAANIRATYADTVLQLKGTAAQPPDPEAAAELFGMLLHTIQDFYAHSNWVELLQHGRGACSVAGSQPDLVDDGYDSWPAMEPWSTIGDVVVL